VQQQIIELLCLPSYHYVYVVDVVDVRTARSLQRQPASLYSVHYE